MDSILLVGPVDEKLLAFLRRVGYQLFHEKDQAGISGVVGKEVIDLILIDATLDRQGHEFCEFFRKTDGTKDVPMIILCPDRLQTLQIKELHFDKIDSIQAPFSLGTVASRIATQIRLRKMSGGKDWTASLSETNAALRDLNQRFQKELEEARSIQQALLPKNLPEGDSFSVAVQYKPLEEVGGDWYFINQEEDGAFSFLLADVTGHGLAAAFIGSMTKLALAAAERQVPGKMLGKMNELMAVHLPQGRFVTANAYHFAPSTGVLQYARAGGPQAIHFKSKTKETVELKGDGFPIGFFEEGEYSCEQTQMESGDILVVVTDGVTEAQNRNKNMFGIEGVVQSVKSIDQPSSAQEVLDKIKGDFDKFLDGRLIKDDVTVIVLKRN